MKPQDFWGKSSRGSSASMPCRFQQEDLSLGSTKILIPALALGLNCFDPFNWNTRLTAFIKTLPTREAGSFETRSSRELSCDIKASALPSVLACWQLSQLGQKLCFPKHVSVQMPFRASFYTFIKDSNLPLQPISAILIFETHSSLRSVHMYRCMNTDTMRTDPKSHVNNISDRQMPRVVATIEEIDRFAAVNCRTDISGTFRIYHIV